MDACVVCEICTEEEVDVDMACSGVPNNRGALLISTAHWRPLS